MTKALSIRQPWLWAICRGGKTVENRTDSRGTETAVRKFDRPGRIYLHASSRWADVAAEERVGRLAPPEAFETRNLQDPALFANGGIVAAAHIQSVHASTSCYDPHAGRFCSPWADPSSAHLVITDVHVLPIAVPCPGALGLWTVPDDIAALVERYLP